MTKVATNEPAREHCSCGQLVILAKDATGRNVRIEDAPRGGFGRTALQVDLAGGRPVALRTRTRTTLRIHYCPKVLA